MGILFQSRPAPLAFLTWWGQMDELAPSCLYARRFEEMHKNKKKMNFHFWWDERIFGIIKNYENVGIKNKILLNKSLNGMDYEITWQVTNIFSIFYFSMFYFLSKIFHFNIMKIIWILIFYKFKLSGFYFIYDWENILFIYLFIFLVLLYCQFIIDDMIVCYILVIAWYVFGLFIEDGKKIILGTCS